MVKTKKKSGTKTIKQKKKLKEPYIMGWKEMLIKPWWRLSSLH